MDDCSLADLAVRVDALFRDDQQRWEPKSVPACSSASLLEENR
jgi:hypothetical protein